MLLTEQDRILAQCQVYLYPMFPVANFGVLVIYGMKK